MYTTLKIFFVFIGIYLMTFQASGQLPTASFTANVPTPSCVPLNVPFTNTSSNGDTYSWTINGVFFSNEQQPMRIFTAAGTYQICLTVSNANGTDSSCVSVQIYDAPEINFSATNTQGCSPLEVSFAASSTENMSNWTWDFGDGSIMTTTEPNITYTYTSVSNYNVTLSGTNINGCTSSVSQENIVEVFSDITAQFTADSTTSCTAPHTVQFTNTSLGNISAASYVWDFGDGNTSTEENPSHTYTQIGSFDVTLTVTNTELGCNNIITQANYIQIAPSPSFTFSSSNSNDCNQVNVNFTNTSTTTASTYLWEFGDGSTSNQENPQHTYSTAGCFTPQLTITSTTGCVTTTVADTCIEVVEPINLSYTTTGATTACQAPLEVTFHTDYTGDVLWNFGGLDTSTLQNPTFTFSSVGSYPVSLTATLANGCQQTITTTTVEITPPPVSFQADVLEGCYPLDVQFSDMTNINENIVAWEWDFGDGNTSTEQNPLHTYTTDSSFTVSLTITLEEGCQNTSTWVNYIQTGYAPNTAFSAEPTETCIENIISFSDDSNDENIDYWHWDFGDGGVSTTQYPLHEYNDTGWFNVQLITGYNSCYDTLTQENLMHLLPPKSIFTVQQNCSNPFEVSFTNNSIGADTWEWDFGDGNTSTDWQPTHTYATEGSYLVTLTVHNNTTGCSDDQQRGVAIFVPSASFDIQPRVVCFTGTNTSVQVSENTSVNATQYTWNATGVLVNLSQSNDPTPSFQFLQPGQYTGMQLTVTNSIGCEAQYTFNDTITVVDMNPSFIATLSDSTCQQTYQFTDYSSAYLTDIVTWSWDFGDGNSSTEQNPIHTYTESGYYLPRLTITNTEGCTETRQISTPIHIDVPQVSYLVDTLVCQGEPVVFQNNSTASDFTSWSWDFGDGNTSTAWNANHTFNTAGRYKVCFSATNANGCTGGECQYITVENVNPEFTANQTTAACNPLVVSFTDTTHHNNIVAWSWDFGDGSGTSSLQNPTHTYTNSGNFEVCLTVTTASGCSKTTCKTNFIQIGGPTADISYLPNNAGCTDFNITFSVNGNNINSYVMDFGDGNSNIGTPTTNHFEIEHNYTAGGDFIPVLLLLDSTGCQNFVTLDTVHTSLLDASFSSNTQEVCEGASINFSSNIQASRAVQSIEWVFEGGTPSSATGANPTGISFNHAGSYNVQMVVTTAYCSKTILLENYIQVNPNPNVTFTANPASLCGTGEISFQNNSSISTGSISSWAWNLGNGTTSDLEHTSTIYEALGTYQVQLSATSNLGCVTTQTENVHILEEATASINYDEYILCNNQTLQLEVETNGNPVWTPSVGLSCTNCPNPIANPNASTMYYVTATLANGCQTQDSVFIQRVNATAPQVNITDSTSVCVGETTQIIATGGASPFNYTWDNSVAGLSCYEHCSNPLVNIENTSTFTVSVTNSVGCISTASTTIEVIGNDIDILGNNRTICEGDSIVLNVSTGTNPTWTAAASLSCTDCPNPIARPTETTTYKVEIMYQNCTIEDEITIRVMKPSEVNAGENTTICNGQSITLNGQATGNYTWQSPLGMMGENVSQLEVSPSSTTDYILVAMDDLCTLMDTVRVSVKDKLEIQAEDIQTCPNQSVQLIAKSEGANQFIWSNLEGHTYSPPSSPSPIVKVEETTIFTVKSSNGFCESDEIPLTVFVLDTPQVILPTKKYFVEGESVQLEAITDGDNYTFNWFPNENISCTDCSSPTVTPSVATTYTLLVQNTQGCQTEKVIQLLPLEECPNELIVMPTGFTPNNDGKNDILKPLGLTEMKLFRIFNRWGELLFETTNPNEGWDGTYKGKPLGTDVFVWYVETICPLDGSTISNKGDVTLLR